MTGSHVLREDEEDEMAEAEALGIVRYSDDWERWLAMYRQSLRWHWLGLGLAEKDLRDLGELHLRRVFRKAMGYELPWTRRGASTGDGNKERGRND